MWKPRDLLFILPCLLLIGFSVAQDKPNGQETSSPPKAKIDPPSANHKAYDALYSDILMSLPRDGKLKVDSAKYHEPKAKPAQSANPLTVDELKNNAAEKRKKEMDELSPEVKGRVDKILSDLDNRRKEKQTEFKELKE
ncbi:MAG: hypothetical protein ABIW76_20125 [Fibrobacteria bacterium]